MKIKKIIYEIEKIFPEKTAEEFDNVGLLFGNTEVVCSKALVCHDVTDEIIDEALNSKCELIISYHPLIFNSLKKIITHFFSEFSNVNIYGSVANHYFTSPYFFHNFFSFDNLIGFGGQKVKKIKFLSW